MKEEEVNPWKILSERQVYDNNWITVTEYDVLNPSGGEGIYGKVHFRHIAVGVIVLDDDLNTYLVGQYRFPLSEYSWEIPEGGGKQDHDPLDSAKRELLEETGFIAHSWQLILKLHLSNSVTDEVSFIFLATKLEQRTAMPEETERLQIRKLSFDEAWRMVQSGRITDAISVAAFQHVRILQLENKLP